MITVAAYAPSLDLTYVVDDLRLGTISRPTQVVSVAGGKPLNLARAAATLDADVWAVVVLGGPTGQAVRAKLEASGVAVSVVHIPQETRVCVSIASEAHDELTEIYAPATPLPARVWPTFLAELDEAVRRRPGWLALSGASPRGLEVDALAGLIHWGADRGLAVAVDVHGPALPDAVTARPALVKINRYEAAELLGLRPGTDLSEMARRIADGTGGRAVLTDGAAGAVSAGPDGLLRATVPGIRGRFPVGSGDAFFAGLLVALDAGTDLGAALRGGMAAGVANALVPGAGELSAVTVAELLDRVEVSRA